MVNDKNFPARKIKWPIPRTPRATEVRFSLYPSGIGARLLWRIFLFSIAATMIATGLQVYLEYQRNFRMIEARLEEVEQSATHGIARSLYDLDMRQVQLQLEGILSFPDIKAVKVQEIGVHGANGKTLQVGQWSRTEHLRREISLFASWRDPAKKIGVLTVEATLSNLHQQIKDRIVLILITQGLQIFAISLFILYVTRRLVTRHLAKLADFVDAFDIKQPFTEFQLRRRAPIKKDELDRMSTSFNAMCRALQRAYVDLETINKELSAFSYSISHDLRGPLRRISGFAELLMDDFAELLDEKGRHYLQRICDGITDLNDMINGMLKLSHATHETIHFSQVNLSELAQKIIAGFREQEPQRNIHIIIAPNLWVQGDAELLLIALHNLLGNAWKYTQETESPTIEFGSMKEHPSCYFVRDNGVGFDPALTNKLFKPFSRLHSDKKFEGSGIGLATVQRIIIRHGGRVWAESSRMTKDENHRGATFYLTFWEGSG